MYLPSPYKLVVILSIMTLYIIQNAKYSINKARIWYFHTTTVVIAYKNTGYKNISVIRTISPGNRFSSYSFVLEEYRL